MIKAIIIDDEHLGRKLLRTLILENCPEIQILDECADLPTGVKAIRKLKPDLIFLDIEMPGFSGLEITDFFSESEFNFGIIFTTAYSEYAIPAFKLQAIDYLLKPISVDDLIKAIDLFKKRWQANQPPITSADNHLIAIPVGQSIKFIDSQQIIYLKAENTYTEIHLQDQTKLLVSRTLKNFEEALSDKPQFFRCHKSYMINRVFVVDYVKSDGGYIKLSNGKEIPISSDKVDDFLQAAIMIKR